MDDQDAIKVSDEEKLNMWNEVITLFREYMGTGLIVGWFLLALVYLMLKEKRKNIRIVFVYVPLVLLLLYFNPLVAEIIYGLAGNEIYYRILWLLPITVVIAYSVIHLYGQLKGKIRIVFAAICAVLCMISGSFIYSNPFFGRAENLYHVPDSVVNICDAIEVQGREVAVKIIDSAIENYVEKFCK